MRVFRQATAFWIADFRFWISDFSTEKRTFHFRKIQNPKSRIQNRMGLLRHYIADQILGIRRRGQPAVLPNVFFESLQYRIRKKLEPDLGFVGFVVFMQNAHRISTPREDQIAAEIGVSSTIGSLPSPSRIRRCLCQRSTSRLRVKSWASWPRKARRGNV